MGKLPISARLKLAQQLLNAQRTAIANGDGKVNVLFAFQTGGIALLTTKFDDLTRLIHGHSFDLLSILLLALLLTFSLTMLRSFIYSFYTLHPHVKTQHNSLTFFGTISPNHKEYKEQFSNLTQEQLEDDLTANIVATAQIARRKHRYIQHAIQSFAIAAGIEVAIFAAIGIVSA